MREIKFRAWSYRTERMSEGLELANELILGAAVSSSHHPDFSEVMWLQFTGLKDKNGKEIYEGDIVLSASHIGAAPLAVQFTHGAFMAFRDEGHENLNYYSPLDERDEIIGNIYENPDLLTH